MQRIYCIVAGLVAGLIASSQPVALSPNSGSVAGTADRFGRPAPDSRGWSDPALNHNQLLKEKLGDGTYVLIGTYKVLGSPYLFGQRHPADLYAPTEKANNIDISYNTYSQEIEFYSTSNRTEPLVKVPGQVDSFILRKDSSMHLMHDIHFIYGPLAGSKEKAYFQVIQEGQRYSLYKRYKSDLGYPSTNYGPSDLRQFDLFTEYFYYDAQQQAFKKLKPNLSNITKEFKSVKDISPVADQSRFVMEPEEVMKRIFIYLNS